MLAWINAEPERTRAAVVKALRALADDYGDILNATSVEAAEREASDLIQPFSGIGLANGATRAEVSGWLTTRAAAIENGALL